MLNATKGITFDDVILVPGYNGIRSRQDVTTDVMIKGRTFNIPIVSSNMDSITGDRMANFMGEEGGLAILHRFMSIDENVEMFKRCTHKKNTGFSIGVGTQAIERAEALVAAGGEICCVDVAHGHSKETNRTIRLLKDKFKDNLMVIGGNVATYAGADYLAAAGADVIKVGIGPGSVCTTRIKTGYGIPQLTAIMNCARVDCAIIADGGIRTPSDVVKALAAGADMVMLGGMLSGTDETPGEIRERTRPDGETYRYKQFRGMASREAQEDFMGAMSEWKTAEGVALEVTYRGSAKKVIQDIMGGVRSGLTYCGAQDIRALQRKAEFMEITPAARIEGTPHAEGRLTT